MTQATHLIRVEGVNLSSVLDDTDTISVRRGASAMLRTAARDLPNQFPTLQAVTFEASVGVFAVATEDPDPLVDQIADHLSQTYPHLTFVVDAAPLDQGYAAALDAAWARSRFRQLQQVTVAIPDPAAGSDQVCALDRVRPAAARANGESVSASVMARRDEGRRQRKGFLCQTLGSDYEIRTTNDLSTLAADRRRRYGNLTDKIAVIYLDGNGFGKQKRACRAADPGLFDRTVQGYRTAFLRHLIDTTRQDPDFLTADRARLLRLEILLWGGDEVLMVVPAWKGLETLQRFYEQSACWTFAGEPLTHAGGICFCSHKTPIAESTRTAKALAEGVKQFTREENRFDYLVLESIDYPTQEIDRFRDLRYGPGMCETLTPLAPFIRPDPDERTPAQRPPDPPLTEHPGQDAIEQLPIKALAAFLARLPRGAIYGVAQSWVRCRAHPTPLNLKAFGDRIERLEQVNGKGFSARLHRHLFDYLVPDRDPRTGHDHPGWLHLTELWDYLAPDPADTRRTTP